MMKKALAILFIFCATAIYAQQSYTVNGETLVLNKETDGPVVFLWNSTNGQFRYFLQTEDDKIIELVNTKDSNGNYQEEYKDLLYDVTGMNPSKAKLTTYSLKDFIKRYNRKKNGYTDSSSSTKTYKDRPYSDRAVLDWRFGSSAGFTNLPFIKNPENAIAMSIYAELEAFEESDYPRHSLFLGFKFNPFTTIEDNVEYLSLQPSLGYRFRFVNKESAAVYINTRIASFTYAERRILTEVQSDLPTDAAADTEVIKRNRSFQIPFGLGIGTDIKVKENGFITILFDSLFSPFIKFPNPRFPLDFSIGYKFNM